MARAHSRPDGNTLQDQKEAFLYDSAMLSPRLRQVATLLMAIVALAGCGGYVLALDSLLEL